MSFGFWSLAFLAILTAGVALTLAVENWGRWRQPVRTTSVGGRDTSEGSGQLDVRTSGPEHDQNDVLVLADVPEQRAGAVSTNAVARVPETSAMVEVRFEDRVAADRLVAALFAAYAAQRLPEANRVAAWVTAPERPPSGEGSTFEPGSNLRGRPAAVQRLLDCDDEGRSWVTLNHDVDIALGVGRWPVSCAVLRPLVELWRSTRDDDSEMSGEEAGQLGASLQTLRSTWSTTSAAAAIEPLVRALADATEPPALEERVPERAVRFSVQHRSPSQGSATAARRHEDAPESGSAAREAVGTLV